MPAPTIALLAADQQGGTSRTGVTLNFGTPTAGDLLLFFVGHRGTDFVNSLTSGYELVEARTGGNQAARAQLTLYKKTATGSETSAAVGLASAGYVGGAIFRVTGADNASIVDVGHGSTTTAVASYPDVPSVTTPANDSLVVAFVVGVDTDVNSTFTHPSGYTEILDTDSDGSSSHRVSLGVAWKAQAIAGATGTVTYAHDDAADLLNWSSVHVAIGPSAGGTTYRIRHRTLPLSRALCPLAA